MPVLTADYNPALIFRQGHINTMYPFLLRKDIKLSYQRERVTTPDGDFVDIDWLKKGGKKLAVLCHGLEGSSESQYIKHTARLLADNGITVIAINYRSCSGELNKTATMYHSGFTRDLHHVLQCYAGSYESVHLVGYSLGGNMVTKYASDGVYQLPSNISTIVAISVPCHLSTSSKQIGRWFNRQYEIRFLVTLKEKMKQKHKQFPDQISLADIKKVDSLVDFDEYFTGPLHGFAGAEDYYERCSSLQFMSQLKVPTLLINAQDDPFLSPQCFPFQVANESNYLHFKAPKFGGHVGFTTFGHTNYWNEIEILNFISQ